jgi:site-specific recombinase XerD
MLKHEPIVDRMYASPPFVKVQRITFLKVPKKEAFMLLEDALKGYFMSISADGYAQSTIRMYRWSLGMMATSVGNKEMNDIEPEDLQKFWIYMREEYVPRRKNKSTAPLSGRSLENIWTSMRSFFGWAEKERRVALRFRPDLTIKQPKYTQTVIPPFTDDELKRMFKVAELKEPAKGDARRKGGYRMRRPTAERDLALLWLLLELSVSRLIYWSSLLPR